MEIYFHAGGEDKWTASIALVPIWKDEKILETCPDLAEAAPFLQIAPGMRDVTGRKGEISIVYGHKDLPYSRVMFIGLGEECLGRDTAMDVVREGFAKGLARVRAMHLESAHIPFFSLSRLGGELRVLEEAVYACCLANYSSIHFKKTTRESLPPAVQWLGIGFRDEYVPDAARQAARRGERSAEAVLLARKFATAPGNVMYPETFAEKARMLAADNNLKIDVLDEKDLEARGFGAHLAVGRGGAHPPRLVVLEHAPKGRENDRPIVFVGKGITFDSGGISLKPAAKMHTMKSDMTGAAATLASLVALADEGADCRVIGVMALAENMPDGNATRPGDVVTGLSGDTIEIVNTDAEGRLVLCDALAYVQQNWEPAAIIDIATLTGACAVALGDQVAGLFCSSDSLAERVLSAGHCAGEYFWRLPLWEGYKSKLKSPIADICHTGSSREGGAITAALYLQHFVKGDIPWAHLDIAGVDWCGKDTALCPEGSTGFSARTLVEIGRGGLA
ncbi:MAG: leucyl aminopeptidase [Desulfovibrionaceae bacterium]|nr:leucyl aminopeptidase [Desulfovibrionaceae bacterium]